MNVALRQLNSDIAVLFNPDAVVADDWLQHLVTPFMEDEQIGIAGCKIFYPDGKRLQHAGGYITHPRGSPRHYGLEENDLGQYDSMKDVEYVTGAAMALRRTTLEEVGLFDEGFFLYYEEVDLCLRVAGRGYRVVYVPDAVVLHEESALAMKGSTAYLRQMHASRWRFLLKHSDLEQVLAETVPAEMEWLADAGLDHKRAADFAYRETLRKLPEIWDRRVQDGSHNNLTAPSELKQAIATALKELRLENLQPGFSKQSALLSQVEAKQVVQARP
jgi:GT2 family glycosyltransferase